MNNPVKVSFIFLVLTLIVVGVLFILQHFTGVIDYTDYESNGDKYLSEQQYSKAISAYLSGIKKDPNKESLYIKVANIYASRGRFQDAASELQRGLERKNDSVELNYNLGEMASKIIATDLSYRDIAINAYQNAAKSEKYKQIGKYKSARLYSQKGDLVKAKDIYSSLSDYQPAQYELVLYEINDTEKALSLVSDAQKISSSTDQDQLLAGEFSSWKDFDKAIVSEINKLKQDIVNKKKPASIANSKGYVAYQVNRCEFGVDFFKTAITESEKDVFYPQARILLGECLKRLGNYQEAKGYVEKVYENNKSSIEARQILRQVYRGLKDYVAMKKMYDELVTLNGQDIQNRIDFAKDSEYVAYTTKLTEEQKLFFQVAASQYKFLAINAKDSQQIYLSKSLGINLYQIKDYKEAESVISAAKTASLLEVNEVEELLAWIKYIQTPDNKDYENDNFNKAKDLQNTHALYHMAYIYKLRGDKTRALEKAVMAFDKDTAGYISKLSAEIIGELD